MTRDRNDTVEQPTRAEPPGLLEEIHEGAREMGEWSWVAGFDPLVFGVVAVVEAVRRRVSALLSRGGGRPASSA